MTETATTGNRPIGPHLTIGEYKGSPQFVAHGPDTIDDVDEKSRFSDQFSFGPAKANLLLTAIAGVGIPAAIEALIEVGTAYDPATLRVTRDGRTLNPPITKEGVQALRDALAALTPTGETETTTKGKGGKGKTANEAA